jgi:hypothetical protein
MAIVISLIIGFGALKLLRDVVHALCGGQTTTAGCELSMTVVHDQN